MIGRSAELAAVASLLDPADTVSAARVLLLEGEAGVGKSTLLAAAVGAAADGGWRVRVCRPTEPEARFAYAGLAELLTAEDLSHEPGLPGPQRHALAVALRRAHPSMPVDAHAVVLGTVGALLSAHSPVLLVVDDVPWLDTATATVLAAVARRAPADRVRLLLTRRTDADHDGMPWQLDRHLPPDACRRLTMTGLSAGDLHELLEHRLGARLSRATAQHLHAVSRGNPFYALLLAGNPDDRDAVPPSLAALVSARVRALPDADRAVLLTAAALAVPDLLRLRAARPGADAALERAETAGVLAVEPDGRFAFDHPLTASVLYRTAPAPERRAVHRALAAVEPEPEARARHLALGTLGPSDDVAAGLAAAAADARLRGASDVAAELLAMAVERQVSPDPARGVTLGEHHLEAGDAVAAADALDRVLPDLGPGPLRAHARFLRGTAAWYAGQPSTAVEQLRAAAADAAGDPGLLGRVLNRLSLFCEDDLVEARGHAVAGVAALEAAGDTDSLAGALCGLFYAEVLLGEPPRPELLDRAAALEDPLGHQDHSTVPGIWALALDRWDVARDRFTVLLDRDRARGDLSAEPDLLSKLAETALWADDWAAARAHADDAVRAARQLGQTAADPSVRQRLLLDVHLGCVKPALDAARNRADSLADDGQHLLAAAYLAVASFAAASADDTATVLDLTERAGRHFAAIGIVDPVGRLDPAAERMEALVRAGRHDDADRLLADVRARLARVPRPWLEAAWTRAAAALAADRGDLAGAIDLAGPPAGARPFDRARTLLARGRLLRQARRVGDADRALADAAEIFDRLGARAWSARTADERSRLGLRRCGGDGLTPTEQRVARLAATGHTNRAVAAELVMSPKTVEAHLARVYRKLNIRTRAELGSLLGGAAPDL